MDTIELGMDELRAVAGFAVVCAEPALAIFEDARPGDSRPREAIAVAKGFADGGRRTKAIRDGAWAALRAARETRDAGQTAASEAARAAVATAGAAYLHPLPKATQVPHILGAAAHAARAIELDAGDNPVIGTEYVEKAQHLAGPVVVSVLLRYPAPPNGRGRVGELLRKLDNALRTPE